jgi:hypothetical protein
MLHYHSLTFSWLFPCQHVWLFISVKKTIILLLLLMLKDILQVRNYLTRIAIFKSLFYKKKYMYIEEYFIVERLLIHYCMYILCMESKWDFCKGLSWPHVIKWTQEKRSCKWIYVHRLPQFKVSLFFLYLFLKCLPITSKMPTQTRKKTKQIKVCHVFLKIYWLFWSFDTKLNSITYNTKSNL